MTDADAKQLPNVPFPGLQPKKSGPRMAATRNVDVLTALDNFVQYAFVPKPKVVAAAKLLTQAIEFEDDYLWNRVMMTLAMHTSQDGRRSEQAVNVLIAEQNAKYRAEAFQKLNAMGPKPEQDAAPA